MNNQLLPLQPQQANKALKHTLYWLYSHLDVSEQTLHDYSSRLAPFANYLRINGIDEDSFITYKRLLASDRTIKASTKNKRLTVARIFLRELYRRGHIPRDITVGVKGFKQSAMHKRSGLTDGDVALIKGWILHNQGGSNQSLRLTCVLLLLTYHGLRQIEVCRLLYEDVNFTDNMLQVLGKGRDDKTPIHINPEVLTVIRGYCEAYGVSSGPLFFSISNNSYGSPLSTRGLRLTVAELFDKLGIQNSVHGLRHFYVTKLIEEYPGDLFTVMGFTRHKSLGQLQIYNDAVMGAKEYPRHDRVFSQVLI